MTGAVSNTSRVPRVPCVGRNPRGDPLSQSRAHLPLVAHRWRSLPALQRREADTGQSQLLVVGEAPPDLAHSPVRLLASNPDPEFGQEALGRSSGVNSWGLRGTGMVC